MFYPYSLLSGTAQLPRILSEDVGTPELRNPMLCTKSPSSSICPSGSQSIKSNAAPAPSCALRV